MQTKCEKVLNKFIAIILIMLLTLADIITIGIDFVTYAIDMVATNTSNVEFEAYFKDQNGEKVTVTETELQAGNLNVYVDISVKQEGYFNGKVLLENSNFSITGVNDNPYVNSFDANSVTLNQINSGKTVTIEMQAKPNTATTMNADVLNKDTQVKLQGTYVSSKGNSQTEGVTVVTAKFVSSKDIKSNLDAQILTNKVYEIEGTNKRVVQILVKSKIEGNIYPVKKDSIKIDLPTEAESVEVTARSTKGTNPNIVFGESNYTVSNENTKLEINVENNQDQNGLISFEQNAKDEFVVTCVYAENKTFENIDLLETQTENQNATGETKKAPIEITQEILTYDEKTLSQNKKLNIDSEFDGITTYELSEQENEFYKGKLYTGEERTYNLNVRTYINSTKVQKNISFTLEKTNYISGETKKQSKIAYKEITIKKQDMTNVLGEDGFITIKGEDNTVIANITKETEEVNGYIVTKIPENIYKLQIETSNSTNVGKIDFTVKKSIIEKDYTKEEIKQFTAIEDKITINGKEETKQITLKETTSSAKLQLSTKNLNAGENENVQIKVTLLADNESKDLYKNPNIKITFPKEATQVDAKYKMLYANGLEQQDAVLKEENGRKVLEINLTGEQLTYPGEVIDGTEIIVNANITMNRLMTNGKDNITLSFTNENASALQNEGILQQEISLSQSKGMIATNDNLSKNQMTNGTNQTYELEIQINPESERPLYKGYLYEYYLNVKNLSNKVLENIEIKIQCNNVFENEEHIINIDKLEINEEKTLLFANTVKEEKLESYMGSIEIKSAKNKDTNETICYKSNAVNQEVKNFNIETSINVLFPQTRDYFFDRELITYEIKIKNNSQDSIQNLLVIDKLSKNLEIDHINVNDEKVQYLAVINEEDENYYDVKIETNKIINKDEILTIDIAVIVDSKNIKSLTTLKNEANIYEFNENIGKTDEITIKIINSREELEQDENEIIINNVVEPDNNKDDLNNEKNEELNPSDNKEDEEGKESEDKKESTNIEKSYKISGSIWLDEEKDGDKSKSKKSVEGVNVYLIDAITGEKVVDNNYNNISNKSNDKGEYVLSNIPKGKYMVAFEYDSKQYMPTEYKKQGVSEKNNSDAIDKSIIIENVERKLALTDVIDVKSDIDNIDLGLVKLQIFDLELKKEITKITVKTNKQEKTYEYNNTTLAKVEISPKEIDGSFVQIEYTIKVKNNGEIPGYAKKIVDYLPTELNFDSNLNNNWILQDNYLYNVSLEDEEIQSGETKEIRLILTKKITDSNTGLIGNTAEIYEEGNDLGVSDYDSTISNKKDKEDDFGRADVIIGVKTGRVIKYVILLISLLIICGIVIKLYKGKIEKKGG